MRRLAAVSGSRDDLTAKARHMASVAATPDLSALRDPDDREQRGLELQAMLHELRQTHVKDGIAWRIGGERDLQWIRGATGVARQITAAIPPVFADHATLFRASRNCCFRQTMRKWHTMPLGCVVLVLSSRKIRLGAGSCSHRRSMRRALRSALRRETTFVGERPASPAKRV
jgi:hypothetical protein